MSVLSDYITFFGVSTSKLQWERRIKKKWKEKKKKPFMCFILHLTVCYFSSGFMNIFFSAELYIIASKSKFISCRHVSCKQNALQINKQSLFKWKKWNEKKKEEKGMWHYHNTVDFTNGNVEFSIITNGLTSLHFTFDLFIYTVCDWKMGNNNDMPIAFEKGEKRRKNKINTENWNENDDLSVAF